jgi:hypothetical protein
MDEQNQKTKKSLAHVVRPLQYAGHRLTVFSRTFFFSTGSDLWCDCLFLREEMSGVVVAELRVSPTQAGMQLGALVCNQYVALGNSCKISF